MLTGDATTAAWRSFRLELCALRVCIRLLCGTVKVFCHLYPGVQVHLRYVVLEALTLTLNPGLPPFRYYTSIKSDMENHHVQATTVIALTTPSPRHPSTPSPAAVDKKAQAQAQAQATKTTGPHSDPGPKRWYLPPRL